MYVSNLVILGKSRGRRHFRPFSRTLITFAEVASGVVSSAFVDHTGMDIRIKFGDSRSNPYLNMRLLHFVTGERTNDDSGVRRSSVT